MSELALYNNLMINASDDIKVNFNYQLINRFIDFTDVNNLTIKGYKTCIKHFIKWLVDNQIKQPQRADIKAYKNYLDRSNLSVGTKNQYLRAVKLLFKWFNSECIYPNIADNIISITGDDFFLATCLYPTIEVIKSTVIIIACRFTLIAEITPKQLPVTI